MSLFFFGWDLGFDVHVTELAGFEDFAAFETFHVLRIFVPRDDLDSGMPTLVVHCVALRVVEGCVCWLACVHRNPLNVKTPQLSGILATAHRLSRVSDVNFGTPGASKSAFFPELSMLFASFRETTKLFSSCTFPVSRQLNWHPNQVRMTMISCGWPTASKQPFFRIRQHQVLCPASKL